MRRFLYSKDLVKAIWLNSDCDMNGLDICGAACITVASWNLLDMVAIDWSWLELVALAKLKTKSLPTSINTKKI